MSNKETQNTDQKPEKVMTKYDLKMQRRKEEKEKEEKSRRRSNIIGIAVVVALVCLVASFPIRTYLTVHGTYVKVNGENISRVEFDYQYNMATNNYLNQYGYYLYMMGLDPSSDFTSQMYSENLTWGDYFAQMAVENIIRDKTFLRQAKEEGFIYDVSGDYDRFEEALRTAASENGVTADAYRKELYGAYATRSRLKPVLEEMLYVAAYYDELAERNTPSMEEIQTYYDENTASYDSVDYYMLTVEAQLPTEPTELADPVEEEEESEAEEGAEGEDHDHEEEAYQPSEAEIEAAMAAAKEEADKAEKTIATAGQLHENEQQSAINYSIRDWLFDEERKAGDTTVIENVSSNSYYVLGFQKRYLDETLSVDIRVAITQEDNGQAILDEWKAGAATEESFGEICDKYNEASSGDAQGGLLEGLTASGMPEEISSWTHDKARVSGDTAVISSEDGAAAYVLYYVGTNEPEWILNIRQTVLNQKMEEYIAEMVAAGQVEDPKGHLAYLKVQAEAENEESSEAAESAEGEDSPADGEDAGGEGDADPSDEPSEDAE